MKSVVNHPDNLAESIAHHVDGLKGNRLDRQFAADALGDLRDERATVPLTEALYDVNEENDESVRQHIVEALGKLGKPALSALSQALHDHDSIIRRTALSELTGLGGIAVSSLIAALQDRDCVDHHRVIAALGRIGKPAIVPLIGLFADKDEDVRSAAKIEVAASGKRAVPELIKSLSDNNPLVRQYAAETVGKLRDRRAVPSLTTVLQDVVPMVRHAAISALVEIGRPAAQVLGNALGHQDRVVRLAASEGLSKTKDVRLVLPLIDALDDDYAEIRAHAAIALCSIGSPTMLPVRIISAASIPCGQRVDTLEALIGVDYSRGKTSLRYSINPLPKYCRFLIGRSHLAAQTRAEAAAVLAEIERRTYVNSLLRPTDQTDTSESEQLLHPVSSDATLTPPDELLRGTSDAGQDQQTPIKGWWPFMT